MQSNNEFDKIHSKRLHVIFNVQIKSYYTQLDIFKTSENFFIFELKITFFYPKKREKWSTKIQCLDYADISFIHNLKPVGQPRTFRTPENSKSWSLEVFPWSHRLWAIDSHLYINCSISLHPIAHLKLVVYTWHSLDFMHVFFIYVHILFVNNALTCLIILQVWKNCIKLDNFIVTL